MLQNSPLENYTLLTEMILKKVEIIGFKSFAKRVVIEFDQAITAVVGPNGSGKSNIVDAIRWALGEQKVKSLRGSKMEDVIYAGGMDHAKALGYASVSLVFDNHDKIFSVDYEEVNVTRKYYRSGESEYSINKVPCRLRDISELFMDTGLGREGYSIISQGGIDAMISASPQERRLIIEEACGIVKYKSRKQEAEKKLENAEANLVRLGDILDEISLHLPSLKRANDKAQNYINISNELKTLEIGIFVERYDELSAEAKKIDFEVSNLSRTLELLDAQRRGYEDETTNLKNELSVSADQQKRLSENLEKVTASSEQVRIELRLAQSRLEVLSKDESSQGLEAGEIEDSLNQAKQLLEQLTTEQKELSSEQEVLNHALAESINDEREDRTETIRSAIDELKVQIQLDTFILSQLSTQIENANAEMGPTSERLSDIETENASLELRTGTLKEEFDHEKDFILRLDQAINEKNMTLSELEAKLETLNHSELRYRSGVAHLLSDPLPGVHAPLGDVLTTIPQFTQAISIALGQNVENLIVNDERTASELIELLNKNKWGRVTFLPLTTIKGSPVTLSDEVINLPGFINKADNLVSSDPLYKDIISNQLSRTLVVDTFENAVTIAKKTSYRYRIVTLNGELFLTGGAIVGGSRSESSSAFSFKTEIDNVSQSIDDEKSLLNQLLASRSLHDQRQVDLKDQLEEALEITYRLELERSQMKSQYASLKLSLDTAEAQYSELSMRLETQSSKQLELTAQFSISSEQLQKKEETRSLLESNQLKLISKAERLTDRIHYASDNVENFSNQIARMNQKQSETESQMQMLNKQILEETDRLNSLTSEKLALETEIASLNQKQTYVTDRYLSSNDSILEISKQHSAISEKHLRSQSDLERSITERDSLKKNMIEVYGISYAYAKGISQDIDLTGALDRIAEMKVQLKEIGTVNAEAITEYQTEQARFDTMNHQRQDLIEAREELEKIIADVSISMNEQFMTNFELIGKAFNEVFRRLFNGGSALLVLTDPDDTLSSGVEIHAQTPKTRLKNLTMLSGGEKALCAIALLMGILQINPSPFCLFDEVDAALDDANVVRLCEYIKSVREDNQFVIITHKRRTMELADLLYGTSMGPDGITSVVSVRLEKLVGTA
jgi:chromosome segregation protein